MQNFFIFISNLGGESAMVISSVIVALIIYFYHKEERLAGFVFLNYMTTISIVVVLKFLIHKPRNPLALVYEPSYAFPSGHVAAAMITFLLVFYLSRFIKNKLYKNLAKVLAFIWLVLIVVARLYLKVHDVYDIAASILIASLVFYYSLNTKFFSNKLLKREFKDITLP